MEVNYDKIILEANYNKIILVDDNPANLRAGKNVLSEQYEVYTTPSAAKLFELLKDIKPAMILLDIEMPEQDGYKTIQFLKAKEETKDIPVIFITGKTDTDDELKGLDLGAVDYITKPFVPPLLLKRIEVHLLVETQKKTLKSQKEMLEKQTRILEAQQEELKDFNTNLQKLVDEKTKTVVELEDAILKTVADLVESRDDITGGHIERTQRGVGLLVEALRDHPIYSREATEWDVKLLLRSSQLHDVGKIAISDRILQKPGRLDPGEFEEMKKHASFGVRIIEKIESNTPANDFLKYAKIFAGTHHEKWDGSGYPNGLSGENIPLQGRIMALADVYDALISERPYKKAFSQTEAIRIILDGKGNHFDPVLTDVFIKIIDDNRGPYRASAP
ncbi:MAG: response regulator [Treponema sp.]|jgi:putative two-component system response regulator|nr:response regulator [Treponema sp.]